jgi:glycosyltransferase involved in cell wall biosynthesis
MHVISQANGGLGKARNEGVKRVTGKYIWFVDSDDWITHGAIGCILSVIEEFSPEVINVDFLYSSGDRTPVCNNARPNVIFSGCHYLEMSIVQNPVQYYIYSTKFYSEKGLSFIEGYYHEDNLFTLTALMQAKRVLYLDFLCYVHNIRENSIMTSGNHLKHARDMIVITLELIKFLNFGIRSRFEKRVFSRHVAIASGAIFYHWRRLSKKSRYLISQETPFFILVRPILLSRSLKYISILFTMKFLGKFWISKH